MPPCHHPPHVPKRIGLDAVVLGVLAVVCSVLVVVVSKQSAALRHLAEQINQLVAAHEQSETKDSQTAGGVPGI